MSDRDSRSSARRTFKVPPKRLILCCDGTWKNGTTLKETSRYTNVLRISRALKRYDDRTRGAGSDSDQDGLPIAQIVFYQAGLGTQGGAHTDGVSGTHLSGKVEEAYAFLATNYSPGDELFLFGFSRGAYTARLVAEIIGQIGILNAIEMESFPACFLALQVEGKATSKGASDSRRLAESEAILSPWRAKAKQQTEDAGGFLIKCVGCFDTVSSLGRPTELTSKKHQASLIANDVSIFGFPSTRLGSHIELGLHALGLNETRKDFLPTKWTQTKEGRTKGQVLKQVWFAGSHGDIGGGWQEHDLADITLAWMVSETDHLLTWQRSYLKRELQTESAPYGQQAPHDPRRGVLGTYIPIIRAPPTRTDDITEETIHWSVTCQPDSQLTPAVREALNVNPSVVQPLRGLEIAILKGWKFQSGMLEQPRPLPLSEQVDARGGSAPAITLNTLTPEQEADTHSFL